MTIESSQPRYLSSVKLWVLSKVVLIFLNHALSASMSLNATEAVLQTQKHSETFVDKNIASYTWRNFYSLYFNK